MPAPRLKPRVIFALVFACFAFSAGVAMQFLHVPNVKDGKEGGGVASGDLLRILPDRAGEWRGEETPLGATESVSEAAQRVLNFDDYAYRVYQKSGRSFGVYVAYWAPGRMPTHKVASHTPDRCWTENGMRCEEMRFAVPVEVAGASFKPAEWRRFTAPGNSAASQYVLFWHLVGDELYDYGARFNASPHPMKWVRDSLAYAVKGSQKQYFIRITSDTPLNDFLADGELTELWRALAGLGLADS